MKIGYARTSTVDQNYSIEAQIEELEKNGAEEIYKEQVSAVGNRPEFENLLDYCRRGDFILVTKLDRAFRSVAHMTQTVEFLEQKGVALKILNMDLDTSNATGKLMLNLLAAIGEFERDMMKERQREGIERAKAAGKYKGSKPKVSTEEIKQLLDNGIKPAKIAKILKIGRSTVYRKIEQINKQD